MVNWKDEVVLQQCQVLFTNIVHLGIGAYIFEAIQSVGFEWSVITGKRKFRLPMLLYLYTKWLLVAAFCGMLVALNSRSKLDCQMLYTFNQFGGHSAIGGSTLLLMLRSLAIHKRNKWVKYPFAIMALGHTAILLYGVQTVKAGWDDKLGRCVVNTTEDHDLAAVYFVTLGIDTVVMIVTMAGLSWTRGQSGLWKMIWDQGIIYFASAVIANTVPAVVLMVDLNPVMNIIFSVPAIAATTTVATRCFVALSEYAYKGDEPSGIISSASHSQPWTKRLAGPTSAPAGVVHKHTLGSPVSPISPGIAVPPSTVQFTRQIHREVPQLDTIGVIMAQDIHLDSLSPTKTLKGSDDSLNLAPYRVDDKDDATMTSAFTSDDEKRQPPNNNNRRGRGPRGGPEDFV